METVYVVRGESGGGKKGRLPFYVVVQLCLEDAMQRSRPRLLLHGFCTLSGGCSFCYCVSWLVAVLYCVHGREVSAAWTSRLVVAPSGPPSILGHLLSRERAPCLVFVMAVPSVPEFLEEGVRVIVQY